MTRDQNARIERMFSTDRLMAILFVVVLWITIGFVFLAIWPLAGSAGIQAVLLIGGALVLLFNTAAIVAMLRHYAADKHFIYDIDIRHLDEYRRARDQARHGTVAEQAARP